MKTDRLLGITVYLLNHGKCSAQSLADRFEVSKRTIQRDMESLNRAGIPVVSQYGSNGGYAILDTFTMDRQTASGKDYSFISTAVRALQTAYDDPGLENILEKITAVGKNTIKSLNIVPDFSVLRENNKTNNDLRLIDSAITKKKTVTFDYTNTNGIRRNHETEPVILTYQWYAWYLLAFTSNVNDYRLYKLQRMENVTETTHPILHQHKNPGKILRDHLEKDDRTYLSIRLKCNAELKIPAAEYLQGTIERKFENGDFILNLNLPITERIWFGVLLSFGNKAEVLEPEGLKRKLCEKSREILTMYSE